MKKLWDDPSIVVYHFWELKKNLYVRTYLKKLLSAKKYTYS